jgi:hypothetical protein
MVDVVQQHLSLPSGDASPQHSSVALFVEFFPNNNERLSTTCDPSCFCLVDWERLTDEAIEVWGSLVGRRVGLHLCISVYFHDLRVR